MRTFLALACLSLALLSQLAMSHAHICMFSPPQRGAMVIDTPGDPSCTHKGPSPCGNVPSGPIVATYTAGEAITVEFQQNLNHFYQGRPGQLWISIATGPNPAESDFQTFGEAIPDFNTMDEVSMTNLTVMSTLPLDFGPCDHCIIRLAYQSNNPDENDTSTTFYQCADVAVLASAKARRVVDDGEQLVHRSSHGVTAGKYDCQAPPQFETNFNTTSDFAPQNGVAGRVSYDATNRLMFIELPNGNRHFSNFTSGLEWLLDAKTGACSLYGLDFWNDWAYGSSQNEVFENTVWVNGQSVVLFANAPADFVFGSTLPDDESLCLPAIRRRDSINELTEYYGTTTGIADPTIFVAPPQCHMHQSWSMTQQGTAEEIASLAHSLPRAGTAGRQHGAATGRTHAVRDRLAKQRTHARRRQGQRP